MILCLQFVVHIKAGIGKINITPLLIVQNGCMQYPIILVNSHCLL